MNTRLKLLTKKMKIVKSVAVKALLFFVLGVCMAVSEAIAQNQPQGQQQARTIFDFKQELNLTDRQAQEIRTVIEDLNKDVVVTRAKLTLIDVEASDLIKSEGDVEQIKRKLRDASDLQISLRIADIVATRKINKTLSPEQLKRWREIQTSARKAQ